MKIKRFETKHYDFQIYSKTFFLLYLFPTLNTSLNVFSKLLKSKTFYNFLPSGRKLSPNFLIYAHFIWQSFETGKLLSNSYIGILQEQIWWYNGYTTSWSYIKFINSWIGVNRQWGFNHVWRADSSKLICGT